MSRSLAVVHPLVVHGIRARVERVRRGTWVYEVYRPDGAVILTDTIGDWRKMYRAAAIRVEALRHMALACHMIPEYDPDDRFPGEEDL